MTSLIDALWSLETIAARSQAAQTEFLLAGPLNKWLRGIRVRLTKNPRIVLLTIPEYSSRLSEALKIGSREIDGPHDLNVEDGIILHVNLRGSIITLLEDPVVRIGGSRVKLNVRDYSRSAEIIQLRDYIIRLAPVTVESYLWGNESW